MTRSTAKICLMHSRLSRQRHATIEHNFLEINKKISPLDPRQHSSMLQNFSVASVGLDHHISEPENTEHDALNSMNLPDQTSIQRRCLKSRSGLAKTSRSMVSSYSEFLDCFFATIHIKRTTKTYDVIESLDEGFENSTNDHEEETSYHFRPAGWLLRLGFQYGFQLDILSSSTKGWKQALESFRPVPDDALIFSLCETGDVIGVRDLMSQGHASIWDLDSRGWTPLHVSRCPAWLLHINEVQDMTDHGSMQVRCSRVSPRPMHISL